MTLDDVITALVAAIPLSTFWGTITSLIPWLAVIFVVSLGLYFLRRGVKGASKGKVKF